MAEEGCLRQGRSFPNYNLRVRRVIQLPPCSNRWPKILEYPVAQKRGSDGSSYTPAEDRGGLRERALILPGLASFVWAEIKSGSRDRVVY